MEKPVYCYGIIFVDGLLECGRVDEDSLFFVTNWAFGYIW